jgi:hypothetical protein
MGDYRMKVLNILKNRAFQTDRVRKISSLILIVLLAAVSYFTFWAYSSPTEASEETVLFDYALNGEFSHQVYTDPNKIKTDTDESKTIYFMKLVQGTDVTYRYRFVTDKPASAITERVKINALLQNAGMWQYEINLVPEKQMEGDFSLDFPLPVEEFNEVFNQIGEELGLINAIPSLIIRANVHTVAETDRGTIDSHFVQDTTVKWTATTMEWENNPSVSARGLHNGVRYEHQGMFDYAIKMGPSILYGAPQTIEISTPPPEPVVAIPNSNSYPVSKIDAIDMTYSFSLDEADNFDKVISEVAIGATLKNQDYWSQSFTLLPERTIESGKFSLTFPLNIKEFNDVIETQQKERRVLADSHDLIIKADVHTTAVGIHSDIDERFSQTLNMVVSPQTIGFPTDTEQTRNGSVTAMIIIPRHNVEIARSLVPAIFIILVFVLLYIVFNLVAVKPVVPTPDKIEYLLAKKKYSNLIVDIRKVPSHTRDETVIEVSSLDGIIKNADNLLKSVLHKEDLDKHSYWVLDGTTRYEYISSNGKLKDIARILGKVKSSQE